MRRVGTRVLMASPSSPSADSQNTHSIDWLDSSAVAYLVLPLILFFLGWFNVWVSIASIGCIVLSFTAPTRIRVIGLQSSIPAKVLLLSFATATIWAYVGGIGHFRYSNMDWLTRDAVLRDLVVSQWPVGYGEHDGQETLLRTAMAYFLPAAVLGKIFGLQAAQPALFTWTVLGITLFFLQTYTLLPERKRAIVIALLVIVSFSGMDVIGSLLRGGETFMSSWKVDSHLEWWANNYQYSSITTQLFWVPNHAIGGWLFVGMLLRNRQSTYGLIPVTLTALALWSPLTAVGALPFALWRYSTCTGSWRSLFTRYRLAWIGALLVSIPVIGYITLDSGRIPKEFLPLTALSLARLLQFYLLEVGIVGWIAFTLRPYRPALVALIVLLFLPLVKMGVSNDFVMRASIPSLAVVAIMVATVLADTARSVREKIARYALIFFLVIGAVTPMEEIARSFVQARWDPHNTVNLVGATCGYYWPHYIAKLDNSIMHGLLRSPHALPPGPQSPEFCDFSAEFF